MREDFAIADGGTTGAAAECPAGTTIIGGGSALNPTTTADVHLTASRAERADNGLPNTGDAFGRWRVSYRNPAGGGTPGTANAQAFAICAQH